MKSMTAIAVGLGLSRAGAWVLALLAVVVVEAAFGEPERRGLQASGSLRGAKLQPARLDKAKLQGARLEAARPLRKRLNLAKVTRELARNELTPGKVQGAVSSIPPSRLGELFFDVARELESIEGGVTGTSLGYYMAALTDAAGVRYQDAKRRVVEILLQGGLEHPQAAALYDEALATMMNLYRLDVGITRDGLSNGFRDLHRINALYRERHGPAPAADDVEP